MMYAICPFVGIGRIYVRVALRHLLFFGRAHA